MGLHAEDIAAQGIAFLGQAADQLGGLVQVVQFAELMAGIARQEVGQERLLDGGERAERFQVAGAAAVAFGLQALGCRRCSGRG